MISSLFRSRAIVPRTSEMPLPAPQIAVPFAHACPMVDHHQRCLRSFRAPHVNGFVNRTRRDRLRRGRRRRSGKTTQPGLDDGLLCPREGR
jgi:hypothetical protein